MATASVGLPFGTLRIGVEGLEGAIAHLEAIERRMRDQTPAWRAVGQYLLGRTAARWGQGWAARKQSYPWPILKQTGALFAQVTSPAMLDVRRNGVAYRVPDGKGVWHHFGTSRGLPARPLVRAGGEEGAYAARAVRAYIMDGSAGMGGPWGA